jgi:hypothetical protein
MPGRPSRPLGPHGEGHRRLAAHHILSQIWVRPTAPAGAPNEGRRYRAPPAERSSGHSGRHDCLERRRPGLILVSAIEAADPVRLPKVRRPFPPGPAHDRQVTASKPLAHRPDRLSSPRPKRSLLRRFGRRVDPRTHYPRGSPIIEVPQAAADGVDS